MAHELSTFLARLRRNALLQTTTEEATRQVAILPILGHLGWDWQDLAEVLPEFAVEGNKRVDYSLQVKGKNVVFIEVKRTGEELEVHQKQLLDYAFLQGVEVAALTDGLVWWLYLPLREGSWQERKVLTIDLHQMDPQVAGEHLAALLGKNEVATGTALTYAQKLHSSNQRVKAIEDTLPKAWNQLLTEPDGPLGDLLAERVESISGHRPDDKSLAEFLLGAVPPAPATPPLSAKRRVARVPASKLSSEVAKPPAGVTVTNYTWRQPCKVSVLGVEREVVTWRAVVLAVFEVLAQRVGTEFEKVLSVKGPKRGYFSKDRNALHTPQQVPGTGIYVEVNLSANVSVSLCRRTLEVLGFQASDLSVFVTEDTGGPAPLPKRSSAHPAASPASARRSPAQAHVLAHQARPHRQ